MVLYTPSYLTILPSYHLPASRAVPWCPVASSSSCVICTDFSLVPALPSHPTSQSNPLAFIRLPRRTTLTSDHALIAPLCYRTIDGLLSVAAAGSRPGRRHGWTAKRSTTAGSRSSCPTTPRSRSRTSPTRSATPPFRAISHTPTQGKGSGSSPWRRN